MLIWKEIMISVLKNKEHTIKVGLERTTLFGWRNMLGFSKESWTTIANFEYDPGITKILHTNYHFRLKILGIWLWITLWISGQYATKTFFCGWAMRHLKLVDTVDDIRKDNSIVIKFFWNFNFAKSAKIMDCKFQCKLRKNLKLKFVFWKLFRYF